MFALKSELNTQDTIALDFQLQAFQVSFSISVVYTVDLENIQTTFCTHCLEMGQSVFNKPT